MDFLQTLLQDKKFSNMHYKKYLFLLQHLNPRDIGGHLCNKRFSNMKDLVYIVSFCLGCNCFALFK